MYCQVVFFQGEELEEVEDRLYEAGGFVTNESLSEAIQYMSGWDCGSENEFDDALSEEIERHPGDDFHYEEESGYTIVTRRGLYASLWRACK